MMIAAGVKAKALSEFLGHASVAITLDRYGHLMAVAHSGRLAARRVPRLSWRVCRRVPRTT
jgi:integrase